MRFKKAIEKSLKLRVHYMAAIKNRKRNKRKYWDRICLLEERKQKTNHTKQCPSGIIISIFCVNIAERTFSV